MLSKSLSLLSVAAALTISASVAAGDWPQILGPQRSGVAAGEHLADKWPSAGPKVLWRFSLGAGYAGAAVAGNRVVVFHRSEGKERLQGLDAVSGRSLWKADFPATYRGGIDPDTGPRCVPLISDDNVFAFGAAGDLYAVNLADGKTLWTRALYADYGGDEGYFGAGSTPVIAGSQLLVNVGGRGAGIVALNPATGKTLWQATNEAASYSAPTVVDVNRNPKAIFLTRLNCVLVDPAQQKVTTLFPFGQRGPTVNAATPLVFGDRLFVTASYGIGAMLASFDGQAAKKIWASDDAMSSQYATPVYRDGYLYGIHGREDVGVAELRCIEAATGKVQWSKSGYGVAHLILAGSRLLIQKVDGHLALAAASPQAYRELASARITDAPTRALPALSNGRLFVRAGSGGGEVICLEVGQQ
jgi:outer membrane protein assembly factor BamB